MYKRMLNILIVILLIVSLVACTGKAPTSQNTPDSATAGDKSDSTGDKSDDTDELEITDWRVPYEEPVEIVIAINEVPNATFADGEDMTNNLWTKMWKDKYNIDVVVEWVSDEYETKLNLAIASGTIPDAFWCNTVQFNQLAEAGQIEDLKSVYDTYASDGLKKMMEDNMDIVETATSNGELLAIPQLHYGYETMTSFMWARKDWMEAAGLEEIKTMKDLEDLMDTFMADQSASFGIMEDRTLTTFFQMSPAFHAYPKIWVDGPDGSIVYGGTLSETKDALAKWAEWYSKGYLRKDFTTLDHAAMLEDAYNGNAGLYSQQNWAGWNIGQDMINNQGPDTYFLSYDLPSVDDQKVMYPIAFPNSQYNVVRKGYEHPEVLVKLINSYVHTLDEALVDGSMTIDEVLPFNTNDMHHVTGPFKVMFNHYNDVKAVNAAIESGEEKFPSGNAYLFYNEIKEWLDSEKLVGLGRYLQQGHNKASIVLALDHVDNGQILPTKLWGLQPQALLDYGTTLDDILVEGYTKIITGVEDISYFDTLIEDWKKAGGDEVTAAVNEMYGK